MKQFVRLVGFNEELPLALYKNKKGETRLITADVVDNFIRATAEQVYELKPEIAKQKFATHSFRVGACCILFAAGYSPDFIKQVLRWESDCWRTYVRDLVCTAVQQVVAMNDCKKMPIF